MVRRFARVCAGAAAPSVSEEAAKSNGARPIAPPPPQFVPVEFSEMSRVEDGVPYFSSPWPQDHRDAVTTRPLMVSFTSKPCSLVQQCKRTKVSVNKCRL